MTLLYWYIECAVCMEYPGVLSLAVVYMDAIISLQFSLHGFCWKKG